MAKTASKAGLGWYLERIKSTPLLTAKQERQLARRIREHSDHIAREQMIQANLRLVVNIAKDYSNPGMTLWTNIGTLSGTSKSKTVMKRSKTSITMTMDPDLNTHINR